METRTGEIYLDPGRPFDLPEIFEFVDEYDGPLDIDRNHTKNSLRELVYLDCVLMIRYGDEEIGGIAGTIMPCLYNDQNFFFIQFFYIRKQWRCLTRRVMQDLEYGLLPSKVNKILIGFIDHEEGRKLARYFRMIGFENFEVILRKGV